MSSCRHRLEWRLASARRGLRAASAGVALVFLSLCSIAGAHAELSPARGLGDARIREAAWREDEVFRLHGRVGYQIDLQFEAGESFVGLAAGDLEALSFVAEANHLFLKPRAAVVRTNLTVLTSRREYQFEYTATGDPRSADAAVAMYVLRFTYPVRSPVNEAARTAEQIDTRLGTAPLDRRPNTDYWYCGAAVLKPVAAMDDGLHTRLRFAARGDLPAIFVRNEDGTESLLNFSMEAGDLVVHRIARRLVVRRGRLQGCIVNKAFRGAGEWVPSGTVAPDVTRNTREPGP